MPRRGGPLHCGAHGRGGEPPERETVARSLRSGEPSEGRASRGVTTERKKRTRLNAGLSLSAVQSAGFALLVGFAPGFDLGFSVGFAFKVLISLLRASTSSFNASFSTSSSSIRRSLNSLSLGANS